MEAWQTSQPAIGGNAKVRERFTPTSTVSVNSVQVRLKRDGSGSSPVTVSIMQGTTTVASGTISAGTFPVGSQCDCSGNHNGWGTVSLNATLNSGTTYDLLLTSPSDTVFRAEAIRQGSDYGFAPFSYFADGRMQTSTDGTNFADLQAPYGGNAGQGDLQFWFTTGAPSPT